MARAKTLEELASRLNRAIIWPLIILIILVLSITIYSHLRYRYESEIRAQEELNWALKMYSSELNAQTNILLSASEFIYFIRSGKNTRKKIKNKISNLLARLPSIGINGVVVYNKHGEEIFHHGSPDGNMIQMDLSYLGDNIYPIGGDYSGTVKFYIDSKAIFSSLHRIDNRIVECKSCKPITKIPNLNKLVSFSKSELELHLKRIPSVDDFRFYYIYFLLLLLAMAIYLTTMTNIKKCFYVDIIGPIAGNRPLDETTTVVEIVKLIQDRERLKTRAQAEASQNRKLANEIHDAFGSQLVMLQWSVDAIEIKKEDRKQLNDSLQQLSTMTNNFIEALRPETLDTLGLSGSLKALTKQLLSGGGSNIILHTDIDIDQTLISDAVALTTYRVMQESIANIIKHSHASEVSIIVKTASYPSGNSKLYVSIQDNGLGISDEYHSGHGLTSMRERVEILDGEFNLNTSRYGTKVTCEFNLESGTI